MFESKKTHRGFGRLDFKDYYGEPCSLQESSLVSPYCIWLGVNSANPKIMASHAGVINPETGEMSGWVPYDDIPDNVMLTTRMHLTRRQCWRLAMKLIRFVFTGGVR